MIIFLFIYCIKMGNTLSQSTNPFALKTDLEAIKTQINTITNKPATLSVPWTTEVVTSGTSTGYTLVSQTTKPVLTYNNTGLKVTGFVDVTDGFKVNGQTFAPFSGVDYSKTVDFKLGQGVTDRGDTGDSRALVKENGKKLVVNYANDFIGGVDIMAIGGLNVQGGDIKLNTGLTGTVFANKICSITDPKRCIDLSYKGPNPSTDSGINFTNGNGGQLRFQDDANLVQYSKTNTPNIAFNKLDGFFGN